MKKTLKVLLVFSLLMTKAFALDFGATIDNAFELLDDGFIKGLATIVFVTAGFCLTFGLIEKFKVYFISAMVGIGFIYGAKEIAQALW